MTDCVGVMVKAFASMILALMLGGCAIYGATSGRIVLKDDPRVVNASFSKYDRDVIERYYKTSMGKSLPPGLAKRGGNLPPGLAKRDRLPPGLRIEPLPYELEGKLSVVPEGYIRVRIGSDIVLMEHNSRAVFDVLFGVAK